MNYSQILKFDAANGLGVRSTIFVCGCTHQCPNCFNKELWDFKSGKKFDDEAKKTLFEYLSNPHITGLSILGGEPMQQGQDMLDLITEYRAAFPEKDLWLWTGYKREELNDLQQKIFNMCDYVVDGRFVEAQKCFHKFKGSDNQRIWKRNNHGEFEVIG